MSEWKDYELKDLLAEKGYIRGPFGSSLKRAEMKTEGTPVYEQEHAIYNTREFRFFIDDEKLEEMKRFVVQENDLIISCSGTVGKISIIKKDDPKGIISQALLLLRPNTDLVYPEYLLYFFQTPNGFYQLVNASEGSVQLNISSRDIVEAIPLSVPDKDTQKEILSVLFSLDKKISFLQKQNQTLEKLCEGLFKQWFIKEAKENWKEKSLDEIATYLNGLALQKYPSDGINFLPVIKIKEINQGITEGTDQCSRNIPPQYIIQDGDVLFSWSGSLQVEIWHDGEGALNQHLFKVTSEKYPKWFYYLSTKYHLPEFRMIAESKSTTMGHIQREHLKEALIPIPPDDLFKQYHESISPMIEKVIRNNSQIKTLTKQKVALLPKLMNSEVMVS